jgi:hypothetical protein
VALRHDAVEDVTVLGRSLAAFLRGPETAPGVVSTIERETVTPTPVPGELLYRPVSAAVRAVLDGLILASHFRLIAEWSLPAFLYITPDEFLCILLEDVVDLVEDGVDVLGHLLVALGDLGVDRRLDLLGLLA